MKTRKLMLALLIIIAAGAGGCGCAYLAGHAYFLLNKALPHDIHLDTWYTYWQAYSGDALQRKRLILALVIPATCIVGVPLLLIAYLAQAPRSLYGDARWANEADIRKAGLL